MEHLEWINDQLTILAEAFGETLTEQRQEIYCAGLAEIRQGHLQIAFKRARYELKWFPKLAELRELAGILPGGEMDGRPGPEEAWARMPKGERMDDDSVVWCEEEQIAYGACRSLLLDGDQIGARMAFKERYEREVAEARSQGRPVQWKLSSGFDVESRLTVLATAVQEKRLSVEAALQFVPDGRQQDFAQMLPPAESRGLLAGRTERSPALPGLIGVLAKMRMEGLVPEELRPEVRPAPRASGNRSPEETRAARDRLAAQIEFLRRSRNGGSGAA